MKKVLTIIALFSLVLTLAACKNDPAVTGPTDAELVAEAKTALLLTNLNEVTGNLTLPSTGLHSSVITWSSDNTAFLANDGKVTRPAVGEDNAIVNLTATITIGDESDTKDFVVRVITAVPTLDVTIAEFNEKIIKDAEGTVTSGIAVDSDVVVTGVVFGIVTQGAGVHIYDGTGFLYVYGTIDAVLGDEITVTGQKTIYYGLPELYNVTGYTVNSSGNDLPDYEVTSVVDLYDEDPFDTLYNSKPIRVTGYATIIGSDVTLVATDENNNPYNIIIYYKSDEAKVAELIALEGKMVTADIVNYGFHSTMLSWRVTVNTNAVITSVDATDAQKASFEASQIKLGSLELIMSDLALNATAGAGTVVWSSSNEEVISTAGVVTRADVETLVTLTASVTVGTATATRDFEVSVASASAVIDSITVTEAIAAADDTELVVQGVVSGFNGSSSMLIQDEDGTAIVLYTSGFAADNGLKLGDKIIVRGTRDTYYGLNQLGGVTLLSVVSSDNTVLVHTDVTVADFVADMAGYQGHNVVLTGLVVVAMDYEEKSGYIVLGDGAGNNIIFGAYQIPYALDLWTVGDVVDLSVIVYDVYYDGNRVIVYKYPAYEGETDLFISEYVIGSGNNKAIEIYNPTPYTIALSDYVITQFTGKIPEVIYNLELTGTLAAGEVFVICTDQVTAGSLLDTNCDLRLSYPSVAHFSGNDTVELYKNDVLIDMIFNREDANGENLVKDMTLVRNTGITSGSIVFDFEEWTQYPKDTFDYIGSHTE